MLVFLVVLVECSSLGNPSTDNLGAILEPSHGIESTAIHQIENHFVKVVVQPLSKDLLGFIPMATNCTTGIKKMRLKFNSEYLRTW